MVRAHRPPAINNRILLALPAASLKRLRPMLEALETTRGQVIDHVDGPIRHLYFVNRGLVSVVKTMEDGRTVEVGAVGLEGVTDPNALFGIDQAVLETMVQVPGSALRIGRDDLMDQMARDRPLRELMERYTRFAYAQMAQTAACNRLHSLEERFCRWLLICHDCALSDEFPLTHEFLAMMLGVQRAGVSIAANFLKRAGLIDYARGRMTIADRAGIEDAACECYRTMQTQLADMFRSPARTGRGGKRR